MKYIARSLFILAIFGLAMASPTGAQETESAAQKAGGVKGLEKRIKQLEDAIGRDVESDNWYVRIKISGLVEVEAVYDALDTKDPASPDESRSEIDLSTVELVADAKITRHVDGHVMVKWEADELFVDEGFITLVGAESFPAYLIAGRQYIPFGYYESSFVTDPTTLVLGETSNGAVVAGYRFGGDMMDISVGAFNGRVKKIGDDNTISDVVAAVVVNPIEGLMLGASYTSNLAASDSLSEATDVDGDADLTNNISSLVGGWSVFATYGFLDRFKLIGEYTAAASEFKAGELYDATDTKKRQPSAWNIELGVTLTDAWELAGRYGGSSDGDAGGGEFMAETEYGAILNWGLFENTNLALEYLHSEYQEDFQTQDTVTLQLAIEF